MPDETTNRAGQWLTGVDGHRWWFDSGSIAFDFAFTGPVGDYPETLHEPADLASWLAARFDTDSIATAGDLVDAKALRAAIRDAAAKRARRESPAAADIDVLNLFAATPDIPPSLAGGTRQAGRSRARASQALSAIARAAIERLSSEPERIRECAADDCSIFFYDESRSNNRRWCSMQRCGNRAKVRTFRATRQR